MNRKNRILIGGGLLLVLILGALYLFVFRKMAEDTGEDRNKAGETETLFENAEKDNVERLTVRKNGTTLYTIYRDKITDELLLEGFEANPYSDTFSSIFSRLPSLSVLGQIEDPLSKENYGLAGTESPYTVELVTRDGGQQTVYVGDGMVSGGGYYAQKEGSEVVYTVSERISLLFSEKNALLSRALATPMESNRYYYTEHFALYKDLRLVTEIELVPEEERESGDAYGAYRMLYPASYTPADSNYDTVLRCLMTPQADSIVTTELIPENLEQYGLTVPSYEVYYTLDGKERCLYFGNRTGDGLIYVMSHEFGFIGLVSVEKSFPFLDWDLIKFVNPALFGLNIDQVASITVSTPASSESYRLDGLGDELTVTAESTGKAVDTYNFRQFYRVLLMTAMEGYADSDNTDHWVLSFTVETRSGKITEYAFYQQSTRKCYYTVNGTGEFYVSVDDVNKIISDAAKLKTGEAINADSQL